MGPKKILIVDDERDLCDILLFNLEAAGYVAEAAYSAEDAWAKIVKCKLSNSKCPDLLLLDVMMPGMSGFELAERLRHDERIADIPIIFLTAKDTEADTLQGFSLGADDYVAKPFSVRELLARVKAVLGRSAKEVRSQSTERLRVGELRAGMGLSVDRESKTVSIDGETVALTHTEYRLLCLLLENQGRAFNRQQLLEQVWPQDVIVTERTVDVNIARLRKKLNRYAACLVSRTGFGYSFDTTKL